MVDSRANSVKYRSLSVPRNVNPVLGPNPERSRGDVKNTPKRYCAGHNRTKSPVEYLVDSRGCWVWQRGKNENGYGLVRVNGKITKAHRAYYERFVGPIPVGLDLDHLCRNRACVNPAHLEPVTRSVNLRRGIRAYRTPDFVEAVGAAYLADPIKYGRIVRLSARFGASTDTIRAAVKEAGAW